MYITHHHQVSNSRRIGLGMITTAITLPVLVWILMPQLELQARLLCAPAAHLVGLFLSAPVHAIDGINWIYVAIPIEVATACSAIKFFSVALAVVAGLAVERRWPWHRYLILLPLVYVTTLLANASRIISTWYIDSLFAPVLPTSFQAGLHTSVGASVFMSFLIALYITLGRITHEHGTKTPAA